MQKAAMYALGALFAFACGPIDHSAGENFDDPGDPGDPNDPGNPGNPVEEGPCTKMDIVFVVDDSGSMQEEQGNLATNFPQFVSVLDNYLNADGEEIDYRLAVTTTGRDLDYTIDPPPLLPGFPDPPPIPLSERGDNGVFRQECGMTRPWLERNDANVSSTFSCAAQVGTGGPSLEMPLLAIEWALGDRVADGNNSGFLREDALLALVVLTDEDDCSRADNNFTVESDACDPGISQVLPVDHYLGYLDDLTGARGRWATAVIAGPGPGTCSSSFGDAIEAERLKEFVGAAGENAVFSSICEGNLASALSSALDTFSAACENIPPVL